MAFRIRKQQQNQNQQQQNYQQQQQNQQQNYQQPIQTNVFNSKSNNVYIPKFDSNGIPSISKYSPLSIHKNWTDIKYDQPKQESR